MNFHIEIRDSKWRCEFEHIVKWIKSIWLRTNFSIVVLEFIVDLFIEQCSKYWQMWRKKNWCFFPPVSSVNYSKFIFRIKIVKSVWFLSIFLRTKIVYHNARLIHTFVSVRYFHLRIFSGEQPTKLLFVPEAILRPSVFFFFLTMTKYGNNRISKDIIWNPEVVASLVTFTLKIVKTICFLLLSAYFLCQTVSHTHTFLTYDYEI